MTPTSAPKRRVVLALFSILTIAVLAFAGQASAGIGESSPLPAISSDKPDYAPGETVTLSGAFWAAGEAVHVVVNDSAGETWRHEADVVAAEDGSFSLQFNLPDWFVAVYTATASGASGTATTTFTDANVVFTAPAPTRFPAAGFQSVAKGASHDFPATVTRNGSGVDPQIIGAQAQGGNPGCADPQVATMPSGWLSVRSGGVTASSSTPIAVSGSTTISLRVSVPLDATAGDYQARFRLHLQAGTGNANDNLNFCIAVPNDTTPPVITPTVTGTLGDNGWYTSDVSVSWTVTDPDSAITSQSGCGPSSVTSDTSGVSFTCTATSAGGTASNSVTIKRDATAPEVGCGSADGVWHATNVDIPCTASDATSGLLNADDASFNLSTNVAAGEETANASTGTRVVSDKAGNESTAGPVAGNMVDRKAPSISCDVPDDSVWYASNVSVECTAADGGSGLADPADAEFTLSTNVADGEETDSASTDSRTVADDVGNEATAGPYTFMVDRKAPQLVNCEAPDGQWHAGNVTLTCTYSDGGSGPASQEVDLTTDVAAGDETNNAVASAGGDQACDAVGNCAASPADIAGNKVDRKGPTYSCAGAASAWSATDVSRGCTAADGGSGLDPASDASFSLSTNVPAGTETDDAQTGTKSLKDAVGNTTTAGPLGGNKVDKKGPVVTLVCPAGPIIKGNAASATWSATDGGSGVAPPSSGSIALDTSTVGTHSASAPAGTASDNVGNASPASAPCSYTVVFDWTGFFQPIDNNPDQSGNPAFATVWNSAKAGQAIPVKFSLHGDQGLSIFQAGYPKSTKIACPGALPVVDAIETYAASTPGLHYDPGADQYNYVWKTSSALANTCQRLEVKLVDGTSHYAFFKFVK